MKALLSKRLAASVASLSAIVAFGAFGTYSAFTDTSTNGPNSFEAGSIKLTDDDGGNAMFALTGMLPGDTVRRCINVANAGTSPFASVSLSGAGTGALAPALKVTVDRGTGAAGGSSSDCTGFNAADAGIIDGAMSAFPSAGNPITEHSGWARGATKSYRFTVTLDANAAASMQGKPGALDVTWTASS